MWVVADEDYDLTLVDFALLSEHNRLEQIAETDRMYAHARLVGVAFADLQALYDEHRSWRSDLIAVPATPQVSDDLMARAAKLWQRCREAEARHGAH